MISSGSTRSSSTVWPIPFLPCIGARLLPCGLRLLTAETHLLDPHLSFPAYAASTTAAPGVSQYDPLDFQPRLPLSLNRSLFSHTLPQDFDLAKSADPGVL